MREESESAPPSGTAVSRAAVTGKFDDSERGPPGGSDGRGPGRRKRGRRLENSERGTPGGPAVAREAAPRFSMTAKV